MLWKKREFTTLLTVDEDERDPNELRTAFTLIRSVSHLCSPSCVARMDLLVEFCELQPLLCRQAIKRHVRSIQEVCEKH